MKPLKLKLENFGSYVDETIDFTEFDEVPLFLISGKRAVARQRFLMQCVLACLVQRLMMTIVMVGRRKNCALTLPTLKN